MPVYTRCFASFTHPSNPTPPHQVITNKGEEILVDTPAKLPSASERQSIMEPYVKVEMLAPTTYTVGK
jgi:translation elongation factor EF-4